MFEFPSRVNLSSACATSSDFQIPLSLQPEMRLKLLTIKYSKAKEYEAYLIQLFIHFRVVLSIVQCLVLLGLYLVQFSVQSLQGCTQYSLVSSPFRVVLSIVQCLVPLGNLLKAWRGNNSPFRDPFPPEGCIQDSFQDSCKEEQKGEKHVVF